MKWADDAEKEIKKVPFFVRKKVKNRVETFVRQKGETVVGLLDVKELKKQFLSKDGMEKEVKGYDVASCFGSSGCRNVANSCMRLAGDIGKIIEKEDILSFLKENVKEGLKFHHEFKVVLADCPNACSRPQIVDIGVIGAHLPGLSEEACTLCSACIEVCAENAVFFDRGNENPVINYDHCLMCGKCIKVCSVKTIKEKEKGFRVLLGGRLGRHPRLGMEVPGICSHDEVLSIVQKCLKFYKEKFKNGQRFSHILSSVDQIIGDTKVLTC